MIIAFSRWMYMARNDEFTLERAKPCRLSAPVRSISVTAAYLSTACRLKIPLPLLPPHYRPTIDLRSNREKHEIPSFLARFTKSDSSSRKEFQLYELDLHIGRTERLLLASRPEKVRKRAETVSFLSLTRVLDTRR